MEMRQDLLFHRDALVIGRSTIERYLIERPLFEMLLHFICSLHASCKIMNLPSVVSIILVTHLSGAGEFTNT